MINHKHNLDLDIYYIYTYLKNKTYIHGDHHVMNLGQNVCLPPKQNPSIARPSMELTAPHHSCASSCSNGSPLNKWFGTTFAASIGENWGIELVGCFGCFKFKGFQSSWWIYIAPHVCQTSTPPPPKTNISLKNNGWKMPFLLKCKSRKLGDVLFFLGGRVGLVTQAKAL